MKRPPRDFVLTEEGGEVPIETTHLTIHPGDDLRDGTMSIIRPRLCDYHRALVKVELHKDTRYIQQCAFRNCTSLKEVVLSEGLQVIGQCSFTFCISLARISVPSTVEAIQHGAFWECHSLCEVDFLEGLRHVGSQAFQDCTSLFAVSLPRSLESVGLLCFRSCKNLCGVEMPSSGRSNSQTVVGRSCFEDCKALVNTILPPRVQDDRILQHFFPCERTIDTIFHNHLSIKSLRERFVERPVHEACYHASKTNVQELIDVTKVLPSCGGDDLTTDGLRLTPFHIVATSAILRTDLLVVLLDKYPMVVLEEKDRFGKTMMDYLVLNPSSKAIRLIQMVLEKTTLDTMSRWSLRSWRLELSEMVRNTDSWEGDHEARARRLQEVLKKFKWFKRTEQTTLMELALWKMKLAASSPIARPMKVINIMDREAGLITCGADVAIPNVICFLFK